MIAPCVDVLRHLSSTMNKLLGSDQGTAHDPANLAEDITDLMVSLHEHDVYTLVKGRRLDDDDPPVTDIITMGLQILADTNKGPIDDYNETFCQLQARRRLTPIVGPTDIVPELFGIQNTHADIAAPITYHQPLAAGTQANMTPVEDREESESGDSDEEPGEAAQLMEDDEDNEPLLRRETAGDVALDMDAGDYLEDQKAPEHCDIEGNGGFGAGEWNADEEIDIDIF